MKIHLFAMAVSVLAVAMGAFADPAAERPNIILILADDLGPGMLSCNGQKIVKTPHIDRLADEGISFENYYGGVFCAPARWMLMTGMHDGRIGGLENNRAGLLIKRDSGEITEEEFQKQFAELKAKAHPIADNEVFLAEVARQAGYKTAQFGKLDRGFLTWHERVKRFGWDHYEGLYSHVRCHGFYPPYIWRDGEKVELEGNPYPNCGKASQDGMDEPVGKFGKTYCPDVFVESLLTYIREHGEAVRAGKKVKPFFIYHPSQLPHGPSAVPYIHEDYINDKRLDLSEKKYATMVKFLDNHVGRIMDELRTQGLDENTIVFFASDNGHEMYSGPFMDYKKQKTPDGERYDLLDHKFRTSEVDDVFNGAGGRAGLKRSGYQGGMQCPLFARWPGKISAGQKTKLLTVHYDFLATVADLGGIEVPRGKDGISYLPTMLGKPQTKSHDYVVVHNRHRIMGGSALIMKDGFKLIEDNRTGEYQLYNILEDNEERHELSAEYPEKVRQMAKILKREIDSPRPDLETN
ncbi:arylsulfatase [Pontiella agarivorans]|uniref:Arylsulfatase n=1 Tax=Pontiella agarivorans TaxID=3038953 RepID=A0ABU5MSH2_9BACT|nr:arylsulfatase [Pontiella agarivorans]MDZ8117086.1 arylsulfatase [Pontiella agarivorans]